MIDINALPKIKYEDLSFAFDLIPWLTEAPYLAVLSDDGAHYHVIAIEKHNLIYEKIAADQDWVVHGGHHGIQAMLKEYCYLKKLWLIQFKSKPVDLRIQPCIEHLNHDAIRFITSKPFDEVKTFFKKHYSPFGTFAFNDFMNSLSFLMKHFEIIDQNGKFPNVQKHMKARQLSIDWNELDYQLNDALEIVESCICAIPQVKKKK